MKTWRMKYVKTIIIAKKKMKYKINKNKDKNTNIEKKGVNI